VIPPLVLRGTDCIIFLVDVTKPHSFDYVKRVLEGDTVVRGYAGILCGTKVDQIQPTQRLVSQESLEVPIADNLSILFSSNGCTVDFST